ncbi:MAG: efflux RND transporter permease subunit [Bacilli bacterium]
MSRFTAFALKNGAVVAILVLFLIGVGLYSGSTIPMQEYPNVAIPWVQVSVPYPGSTPQQAFQDVGRPLEKAFAGISGLKNMYDFSAAGAVNFSLEFHYSRPISSILRDIRTAVANAGLPSAAGTPQIQQATPGSPNVFQFALSAPGSLYPIQDYAKQTVQPALLAVNGVSSVDIRGAAKRSIYIDVNPALARANGVTLQNVASALQANQLNAPTGDTRIGGVQMPIVLHNQYASLAQIRAVPIVTVTQNMNGLKNAFQGVHSGMSALGTGLGSLARMDAALQAEIGLSNQLNSLALASAQVQTQMALLRQQPSTNQAVQAKLAALQAKAAALQKTQSALETKLRAITASVGAASGQGGPAGQTGSPTATSGQTATGAAASVAPALGVKSVTLGDIATVTYGTSSSGRVITRLDGRPAVIVGIQAAGNANVVTLVQQAKGILAKLHLPPHFVVTPLQDQAKQTRDSVQSMMREAALGALFAMLVTLLLLRNWRATIVAVIAIPLSILAAVTVMNLIGYTLNIMTLSGMAVAIGRVVDDSIVVIENLYRRIRAAKTHDPQLVLQGTGEVGSAIASSTATTVAVFLPMAFVPGIVGHFFAPFAWTVIVALLFSLLVAVTVVPLISKWTLLRTKRRAAAQGPLQRGYVRVLRGALRRKWLVAIVSLALLLESGTVLMTQIGFNFLPSGQTQSYSVDVTMHRNARLSQTEHMVRQVEQILRTQPGVSLFDSYASGAQGTLGVELANNAPAHFSTLLRDRLRSVHGAKSITVSGQNGLSNQNQLFIQVNSANYTDMAHASRQIANAIRGIPGLAGVVTTQQAAKPQVVVNVRAQQAARYGVSPAMIASELAAMVTGQTVGSTQIGSAKPNLILRLQAPGGLGRLSALRNQLIDTMTGNPVRLGDVATVGIANGPTEITRLNQTPYIAVTGQITAANAGGVTAQVNKAIAGLKLPSDVTWQQQGAAQSMNNGFVNLALAMVASLVLVFMIMLLTFSEFAAPLAILTALPFCLVGGANALWIVHQPLGMPGMIGFLMLIGIVVTNAIVLMDRVHRNQLAGMRVREAIVEAGAIRLRPILMTATATICALLPLAYSTGAGVISSTLAIVVIGGLLTSTLLTLIIVPSSYETLLWIRKHVFRLKDHPAAESAAAPELA